MTAAASAAKWLRAVPPVAWIGLAGAGALYLIGRRALDQLGGGAGGAAGIGQAIGAGAASLVQGGVEGIARGTGGIAAVVIKAPSLVVDSTVQGVTDGRALSLGDLIFSWFHEDANLASDRRAREILAERRARVAPDERNYWDQLTAKIGG